MKYLPSVVCFVGAFYAMNAPLISGLALLLGFLLGLTAMGTQEACSLPKSNRQLITAIKRKLKLDESRLLGLRR